MRVMLVAAIATNVLSTAAHASGSASRGSLPGHGKVAFDAFSELLAELSGDSTDASTSLPAANDPSSEQTALVRSPDAASPPPNALATRLAARQNASFGAEVVSSTSDLPPAVDGKPSPKPSTVANLTTNTAHDGPKVPGESNSVLAQLLLTPNSPQPVSNAPQKPDSGARPVASDKPAAAASVPTDALAAAQFTDAVSSGIVGNGASVKTPRAAKTDANPTVSDSLKTQPQASTAGAIAALSTAATRNFGNQQISTANALPVHQLGDQKSGTGTSNSDSNRDKNSSRGQSTPTTPSGDVRAATQPSDPRAAAQTSDIRPAAQPAPLVAAPAQPAQAAGIQADAGSVAANNSAAPAATTVQVASSQVPVTLQVAPANASLPLDTNQLAISIAAKSEAGSKHFDIKLSPADLGRVDVRLTVDDAGKAQASLSVEKPQTLALLQKDSSQLERALKDAGLDLSQNGLNFSLKGQQHQNGSGNSQSSRGRVLNVTAIAAVETTPSTTSLSGVSASDTRLDIRV